MQVHKTIMRCQTGAQNCHMKIVKAAFLPVFSTGLTIDLGFEYLGSNRVGVDKA